MSKFQISRERMVREQLEPRGITDSAVLDAMRRVPRHHFVPEALQSGAYDDHPLPIGHGQTISQPFVVALMSQLLDVTPGMRVLEIGTGSGYQAAVLYAMGLEVFTVERIKELYSKAGELFLAMKMRGVRLKLADGTEGWAEVGPFDRIIVTAGGPVVPEPLVQQLAIAGKMVIPVGNSRRDQQLICVEKNARGCVYKAKDHVSFVDLVGAHGW